jgi:hypothetical protein
VQPPYTKMYVIEILKEEMYLSQYIEQILHLILANRPRRYCVYGATGFYMNFLRAANCGGFIPSRACNCVDATVFYIPLVHAGHLGNFKLFIIKFSNRREARLPVGNLAQMVKEREDDRVVTILDIGYSSTLQYPSLPSLSLPYFDTTPITSDPAAVVAGKGNLFNYWSNIDKGRATLSGVVLYVFDLSKRDASQVVTGYLIAPSAKIRI